MKFDLHQPGVDEIVDSARARRALTEFADDVKDEVENQGERFANTHHFARSIETTEVVRLADGIGIAVHSTDHAAHLIEWGSVNNVVYAPFRKAASSLGLKLGPGRRL